MSNRQGALHLQLKPACVSLDGSFLRFLLVGATNFVVSYSVFRVVLLIPIDVTAKATICQLASYGAGIAWSFVWNRRFTFSSRERAITQVRRFISLQIVLALTSAGVIGLLVDHLEWNPSVSWFLVMGVMTIVNYLLCRAWAFRRRLREDTRGRFRGGTMLRDFLQRRPGVLFLIVASLALALRVLLLFTVFDNLRHGSAAPYGSAALGFVHGQGLTTSVVELKQLDRLPDNVSGDYYVFKAQGDRQPQTEFLPGPAFLLGILWKITGVHNYAPYLLLQALIESLLIAAASVVIVRRHILLGLATTAFLIIDLAAIKRTLMMGYDFWPQFGVLVYFTGTLWLIDGRHKIGGYLVVGVLLAVAVWFREITTFLPFVGSPFLLAYLVRRHGLPRRAALVRLGLLLLPVLLSVSLLSGYRLDTTGNARPTRSTFWHTFFAGVGQFSNPYSVESNDRSVWELGKRLDPSLADRTLDEMYSLPDSPYESALRNEAKRFVTQHPWLFLRNAIYRVAIMVSPLFYQTGDFLPPRLGRVLWPLGVLLMPLWGIGMVVLWRRDRLLFAVMTGIYVYFFVAFGWFYVVGRVILPFLFLNVMATMAGIERIAHSLPLPGGWRSADT